MQIGVDKVDIISCLFDSQMILQTSNLASIENEQNFLTHSKNRMSVD